MAKNPERVKAKMKEWAAKNKDKVNANARKYYSENKEKCLAATRRWREKNPEYANAAAKKWNTEHPERYKATQARSRWKKLAEKFGMTSAELFAERDRLFVEQKGVCGSCGCTPNYKDTRFQKLVIDHDHTTGKIRGLLCQGCNSAIGQARESPERLRKCAAYIETHAKKQDAAAMESNLVPFPGRKTLPP